METGTVWRLILIGILILIAINVLKGVLAFLGGVLHIALNIAIIVGIIWLLVSIFSKRKAY